MTLSEEYRLRAEAALKEAAGTSDDTTRARWLDIAGLWTRLAKVETRHIDLAVARTRRPTFH